MSRKNKRRLKGIIDAAPHFEGTVKKGDYLTEEMDEVTEALMSDHLWATRAEREERMMIPGTSSHSTALTGTARDEMLPGYMGRVVTPPAKPQIDPALVRALLAMQDVRFPPDSLADLSKPITWILAGNGVFQVRKTKYGFVTEQLSKSSMPGVPIWDPPPFRWTLPRIPWSVFAPAIAFLRWVKKTHDTEGLVRGYWDESTQHQLHSGWTMHVPEQRVTGASVDVANTVEHPPLGEFAMEIHSHPGGGSNFSSTDDANEQRERMFGCVAGLTDAPKPPNFHWRMGTGAAIWQDTGIGTVVTCDEELTFNLTPLACLSNELVFDPFGSAAFPEEWKAMVTAPPRSRGGSVHRYDGPASKLEKTMLEEAEERHDLLEEMRSRGGGYNGYHGGSTVSSRSWKS